MTQQYSEPGRGTTTVVVEYILRGMWCLGPIVGSDYYRPLKQKCTAFLASTIQKERNEIFVTNHSSSRFDMSCMGSYDTDVWALPT